jgi:hypothetical protein
MDALMQQTTAKKTWLLKTHCRHNTLYQLGRPGMQQP